VVYFTTGLQGSNANKKDLRSQGPLICPKCGGQMRIIAFIEDSKVVKKILDYLGIYEFKRDRPPPRALAVA